MDLDRQVVSLKLAKKMKESGFKQESLFYWCIPEGGKDQNRFLSCTENEFFCDQETCSFDHKYISAYTVAELGDMLPERAFIEYDYNYTYVQDRRKSEKYLWRCFYHLTSRGKNPVFIGATEVEIRAKMLIYLAKKDLLNS